MNIVDLNPWWKSSAVSSAMTGMQRQLLSEIISYLDYRQILIFYGVRRSGKTTLIYQLIDHLLTRKRVSPFHILYFSFDLQEYNLDQLVEYYELQILKKEIGASESRCYLFIDEIQKLDDWGSKIKVLYDYYPNLKIVLSGSTVLPLLKGTKESLAGRFFEFNVNPFSFDEFVAYKGASIDKERENLYERDIKLLLDTYLTIGGFIEAVSFEEIPLKRYFKESLIERVIFKDIPESFQINRPNLLLRLVTIIAQRPGMYLDYKNLGNDLNVDQRTIANYFSYLEYSLLIIKRYNYSNNRLTSEKKLKRVYPANTAFIYSLSESIVETGNLLEAFFSTLFQGQFFYRTPYKEEVDIILTNQKSVLPVEIKIRETIRVSDLKPILKFLNRFKQSRALIISKQDDRIEKRDGKEIFIKPYWKYWSIASLVDALMDGD